MWVSSCCTTSRRPAGSSRARLVGLSTIRAPSTVPSPAGAVAAAAARQVGADRVGHRDRRDGGLVAGRAGAGDRVELGRAVRDQHRDMVVPAGAPDPVHHRDGLFHQVGEGGLVCGVRRVGQHQGVRAGPREQRAEVPRPAPGRAAGSAASVSDGQPPATRRAAPRSTTGPCAVGAGSTTASAYCRSTCSTTTRPPSRVAAGSITAGSVTGATST